MNKIKYIQYKCICEKFEIKKSKSTIKIKKYIYNTNKI